MANANGGNTALTSRVQNNGTDQNQQPSPAKTVEAYLRKMAPQFEDVLPKHVSIDRLMRVALTTIRTNPKLLQCEVPSLMAAVMQASVLGLEPGILGHCYIIPYGKQATFIIGYKGMIDLARRSGDIQSISAHEVFENDFLELTYGVEESLKHIPWHIRTDERPEVPGALRGAYMVARFKDGGHYLHYMPKHEIDDHRKRSKAANDGPWVTDYIEMCKKTVVRSAWKWLPISIEVAEEVAQADGTTRTDFRSDSEFIDLPPLDETGAVERETAATNTSPQTGLNLDDSDK